MSRPRSRQNRHLPPRMHLKGRTYYLVTGTGSQRQWLRLADNYGQALVEYSRHMAGGMEPGSTFAELAREYVNAEFGKLRPATRDSYSLALANLLKAFGDAPVGEITAAHVGRYVDLRSSQHSANREKAVMSKILELGVRWGWCGENVARKIAYHPSSRRRRIITPGEWKAIKVAAQGDLVPVFMDLAYMTGLRVGDLLALRWKQVTDDGLHVLQGKNRVEGLYELTPALSQVLDRAKRLHGRSGKLSPLLRPETAIIHKRNLQPYTYYGFRSIWRRTVERAKLEDIHIHDIRRTAITAAKQSGIRPADFSLHRTEREAQAYVIEVPRVRPLEPMK